MTMGESADTAKPISAQIGEQFDPHRRQAISDIETAERPRGTVAQVLQSGYAHHERLLRPALVVVAKGRASDQDEKRNGSPVRGAATHGYSRWGEGGPLSLSPTLISPQKLTGASKGPAA